MTNKTGIHSLICMIARRDKRAEADFTELIQGPLTQFLTSHFGSKFSEDDIQEILSQSILIIFVKAEQYRGRNGDSSAWAWTYEIARNQALKWLRTKKREVSLSDGGDRGHDAEVDQMYRMMVRYNPDLETDTIEQQVDERLLLEKVTEIVQQLTPREKLILDLHFAKGYNRSQVASILSVTPARITQIMQAILRKCQNADG